MYIVNVLFSTVLSPPPSIHFHAINYSFCFVKKNWDFGKQL